MKIRGNRILNTMKKMQFVRLSTTEAEKEAAAIIAEEIAELGIKAEYEYFKVPNYEIKKVKLNTVGNNPITFEAAGVGYSGNAAKDGIEADFMYVEAAEDIDLLEAKGKIVLVSQLGYEVYERLAKAEVAGFIAPSGGFYDDLSKTDLDERMLRQGHIEHGQVPGVSIRMKDAVRLAKAAPKRIFMQLEQTEGEGESQNVIAEIKGSKYPEQVIVYTAHYDSVVFSQGMFDNAAGSAILLELLRYFNQNAPLRTVRFIWTGSEERGLFGSKDYVKQHEEELKDIMLSINVDLAGPVIGRDTAIVLAEEKLCHMIEYMYKEIGFPMSIRHDIYSSDCIPFADKGVPAINFVRFSSPGAASVHTRNDDLKTLSANSLARTTDFVAKFSERVVNAYMFPVGREIPEAIVTKIDKYLRKKQLKD